MKKVFFTADTHFNHGNIMKYSFRAGFSDEDQFKFDEYNKAKQNGASKEELNKLNFLVSKESVARMDDYLIDGINNCVGEDDILWHLGDFCFAPKSSYYEIAKKYRDRINCKNVHIVWGNHDNFSIRNLFSSSKLMAELYVSNNKIILSHYAMAIWNKCHYGSWNLYGHSHSCAENWLDEIMPGRKSIDVGVDNAFKIIGEYRPLSFEEINVIYNNKLNLSA